MNKKVDENNIINFLVNNKDIDSLEEKENSDDETKDLNIIVKFNDNKNKEKVVQYINEKVLSINNDERLAFNGFFKIMDNNIKNIEEDF